MKISLEWLSQYVALEDIAPDALAHRLTMATAEVEEIIKLERAIDGVLVGKIVAADSLPGKENLHAVNVRCGEREFTSVCGAPNVRIGLQAAFAPVGTKLAGGEVVRNEERYGRNSEGILCSARELGFSDWHEELLEIPESVSCGTELKELVPANDTILEIDNKSLTHRPDLWGHYGFAREIAAICGKSLKDLPVLDLKQYDDKPAFPVSIIDKQYCTCYTCIALRKVRPSPSPLAIQWRLHAIGQRTFDILVDLTNYVMFEIGQPMHAFDGGGIKEIQVDTIKEEQYFTTLDSVERKLIPGDLMILDDGSPVALAGIMGGLDTAIKPDTELLLLESANFKGSCVRKTAVRLGLRSEASQRFEKNQPPINTQISVARFMHLLQVGAGENPEVLSRFTAAGDMKKTWRAVSVNTNYFHTRVGVRIPETEILGILESLGFQAEIDGELLKVQIPPFRSEQDISLDQDIIEEVARVYGYDNIEPCLPSVTMKRAEINEKLLKEHKIRKLLAGAHKFCEVHTYSWFHNRWLEQIAFEPGETLTLLNPASEYNTSMRTTLLPNLLQLVDQNKAYSDSFRLFELGHVYQPVGEKGCSEGMSLAGISYSTSRPREHEDHFIDVKGIVNEIFQMVNASAPEFSLGLKQTAPWKSPGGYLEIAVEDQVVGSLGCTPRDLGRILNDKALILWFELALDRVVGPLFPEIVYAGFPKHPGAWLDFSIVSEEASGYLHVSKILSKYDNPLLTHWDFISKYAGKGMQKGLASFSFRFYLRAPDRTLSGEEIAAFQDQFVEFLRGNNLALRS